jgi:hypothetical protein
LTAFCLSRWRNLLHEFRLTTLSTPTPTTRLHGKQNDGIARQQHVADFHAIDGPLPVRAREFQRVDILQQQVTRVVIARQVLRLDQRE